LAASPLAFVHPLHVQGHSMEPTLKDGELRLMLRGWCAGDPGRGELWVVKGPEGEAVKRVIGVPGETLKLKEGEVWNGNRVLVEPYVQKGNREAGGPWELGKGYFVMGDNRPASQDSRAWGPMPREAFEGRLLQF
ncbi:MAG TPA: signal peptidase I, partial [Holophagaceae bacterium]|nr:signal peptidase I [Holophagaceae bacterium]